MRRAAPAEWAYRGLARTLGLVTPSRADVVPADFLLHGASAGEVKAARALLPVLRERRPGCSIRLSTTTARGEAAGAVLRLPWDVPQATGRLLDDLRPKAVLLVEGELWPTLLRLAEARQIPVSVLGARLSRRAAERWSLAPRWASRLLAGVTAFAAASAGDAERLCALGADPASVSVCGWLKWPTPVQSSQVDALAQELPTRFSGTGPLLVLGSLHPGELLAFARHLRGGPLDPSVARWLVVPRHARARRRIESEARALPQVSVDHRFGVLRAWYALAQGAAVGGGFSGRGTHDLLEPLQAGRRPIFFAARGDPAGVGEQLLALDCAARLDGQGGGAAGDDRPLAPPALSWSGLRSRFDGRSASLSFLQGRGGLP